MKRTREQMENFALQQKIKRETLGVTHKWMTLGAQKGKRVAWWHAKRKSENCEAHQKAPGKV